MPTGPERRVTGTVSMAHLNVAPTRRGRADSEERHHRPGAIDLALPSAGRPVRGTYAVNAGRVQIVGYDARNVVATGRIDGQRHSRQGLAPTRTAAARRRKGSSRPGSRVSLDLAGRAASVDLRNLPPMLNAPGVPSNLQFAYTLTGRGRYSGDVTLDASTLAGASIAPGTTGKFSFGAGDAPTYAAQGQVSNLDVQQVGRGFAIRALASDRYRSRINATFDVKGSGGGRYPLTLDATGTVVDSEMFGASFPRMDFTTNIAGGDLHVKALGQFAGLDPRSSPATSESREI